MEEEVAEGVGSRLRHCGEARRARCFACLGDCWRSQILGRLAYHDCRCRCDYGEDSGRMVVQKGSDHYYDVAGKWSDRAHTAVNIHVDFMICAHNTCIILYD